jgi:hypothetical protein
MKAATQFTKSSYASTLLIPCSYPPSTFEALYFKLSTKFRLSQISSQFLDFSVGSFPAIATQLYADFRTAHKRNDKTTLTTMLTLPHYDIVKTSLKQHTPLPYTILPSVSSANIVYASVCTEAMSEAEVSKFFQLAVLFKCEEDVVALKQLSVFERRLDVKIKGAWRLAYLEDLSSQ